MRHWLSLLLFTAFIVYASFYPFEFDANRWRMETGSFLHLLRYTHTSTGDLVGNFIAYIPIGLLLRLCLREGARGFWITVLCGTLLSAIVEVLQNGTRHRDPSYVDVLMNGAGTFAGACLGAWFRKPMLKARFMPRLPFAVLLLLVVWVAIHAKPLIPVLEFDRFRVALDPLRTFRVSIDGLARWMACYMIFAELVRAATAPKRFHAMLFAGILLTLLCRVSILGQALSWNELLGLLLALPLILIAPRTGKPAWIVILVLILCAGIAPFRFQRGLDQPFRWIVWDVSGLLMKAFLYIGAAWAGHRAGLGKIPSVLAAIAVAVLVECAQQYMPGRVPELADPLLALSAILILERK